MAIKHRGVKIVPIKITRYEVRDVSGHKLKTFASASSAKHWIDGYFKAYNDLTPKTVAPAPVETPTPRRKRKTTNGAEATA